jgi:hypothetical protein
MIKKWLSLSLSCLLLLTTNSPLQVFAQTRTDNETSAAARIKANVLRFGSGEKSRIKVRMLDGTKMDGFISQTGEDSFNLTNSKTRQSTSIAYRDVAQVKGIGLSKGAKIGLGVGIAAGAVVAVVIAIFIGRYCNNEQC